ncbi:hypothetical protein DFH09DRAFT_1364296 [Mycena vulgaris]|nr:hypothetical protein DFH09DRAFT_1364296 [Mycena vulgaris]
MATAAGLVALSDGDFVRKFHFPPFPPVPDSVKIIPFEYFVEYGTRVVGADHVERDGLGIATIPLPKGKKGKKKAAAANKLAPKKEWWEDWIATGEQTRTHPYDQTFDRVDRLHQAGTDFQKYYEIPQNMRAVWDCLRNFAGISPSTVFKTSKPTGEDDDEISDDDFDADADPAFTKQGASEVSTHVDDLAPGSSSDLAPLEEASKAEIFLKNPVRAIQVFLSSHMRSQGLIWDPRKLVGAPHLLRFFVQYLIRNNVVPEHTPALERALDVIDLAGDELPRVPIISNALPDAFSVACQARWGRKAQGLDLERGQESDTDEPEAKRPRLHPDATEPAPDAAEEVAAEVIPIADVESQDADMDTDPPGPENGWGASGWGSGGWGDDAPVSLSETSYIPIDPMALIPPPPTLLTLLGPTALPNTHEPGLVEWSLRRITSLAPPTKATPVSTAHEVVEHGLAVQMYRAVMTPWLNWDADPAQARPRIFPSASGEIAAHDPLTDDITLLVEPAVAETLCVGMGLGGTWVQLARLQDGEPPEESTKLEKTGEKNLGYWYIDELVMIMPSFWVV